MSQLSFHYIMFADQLRWNPKHTSAAEARMPLREYNVMKQADHRGFVDQEQLFVGWN
jgi:hypothetical protein